MSQNNLKAVRKSLGMTLKEASAKIGVGINALNRWELGKSNPHRNNWVRINEVYRASPIKLTYEGGTRKIRRVTVHTDKVNRVRTVLEYY